MPKRNNEAFKHDTAGQIPAFRSERKIRPAHPLSFRRRLQRVGEGAALRKSGSKKESTMS